MNDKQDSNLDTGSFNAGELRALNGYLYRIAVAFGLIQLILLIAALGSPQDVIDAISVKSIMIIVGVLGLIVLTFERITGRKLRMLGVY